jgi:hypothetical protein
MNLITKKILLTVLILISFYGCRKDHEKSPKESEYLGLLSMGQAKDYLLFKQGTWWVYKNSITNEIDTMVLTSSSLEILEVRNLNPAYPLYYNFDFEYITFNIQSLRDNATYTTYCSTNGISENAPGFYETWEFVCDRHGGFYNKKHTGYGSGTQFSYPFYTDERNGRSGAKFLGKKDSMVLNGQTYYDVVSFSVKYDGAYPYPNIYIVQNGTSIYYRARHIGIIKIEHQSYDGSFKEIKMEWELTDSHIVQ